MDCERQLTSWARITISPVCRISVDFPPMFGPVTMTTRLPACSSPISSESWLHASTHTYTHTQAHTDTEEYTHTHTNTHKRQTKMLQKCQQPTVSFSLDNLSWECQTSHNYQYSGFNSYHINMYTGDKTLIFHPLLKVRPEFSSLLFT